MTLHEFRMSIVLKALRKYDKHFEATAALGISERTLFRYKNDFGITKSTIIYGNTTKKSDRNN